MTALRLAVRVRNWLEMGVRKPFRAQTVFCHDELSTLLDVIAKTLFVKWESVIVCIS